MDRFNYIVYAEGAYMEETNLGAFAYIIIDGLTGEEFSSHSQVIRDTTRGRVFFEAIILALRQMPRGSDINILCDATYPMRVLSGEYKAKKNLDLIHRIKNIEWMNDLHCKYEWKSIKTKDTLIKRCWIMCSKAAGVDFEKMFEEKPK